MLTDATKPNADSDGLGAHQNMRVWQPSTAPRPLAHRSPKGPKPQPLTPSTAATLEWRRRRHVKGVRRPPAAYCCELLDAGYPALYYGTQAECPLPILCTSQTHGARNQNTEWADDVRNLRRITPQPEHRTGRQNRCQTGGCVLPGNNCEAAAKHQAQKRRSQAYNALV